MAFLDFMAPPAHKPQLPAEKIDKEYKWMRLKVFLGIYFGYAAYYLVRKNLSFAGADMVSLGYLDESGIGDAMAGVPIAYAVSKFLMGGLSDRSDSRKFMTIGLVLSALVMIVAGLIPYPKNSAVTTAILFVLMCLTGWFSGMGWPPCGRVMSHWFSTNERSFKMSIWNTAHNVGSSSMSWLAGVGGVVLVACGFGAEESWRATFIIPSIAALLIALMCWIFIRDTPESCGLPPIDKYRNDFSGAKAKKGEEDKIPFKTLFVDYVLKNKMLWFIGLANILVYLVRYGISDWLPIYLQQVHGITKAVSKDLYAYHMLAAIPGTLIAGWLSSRFFQGRCAPVNVICMAITALGAFIYWQAEPLSVSLGIEYLTLVTAALIITGFGVYGPVAMISIQAIAIVPKNAAGTAAGFMGLLGYLIGDAILSKIAFGRIVEIGKHGWEITFIGFFVASVVAAIICFIAMGKEKKMFADRIAAAKAEQK
ncbi:MAG: MFS transporter [Alistipes sp.]|nr:MFS transporter [Alistipes sp.]MBQ3026556.1 MFS transporter [Alistipes sp.]